MAIHFTVFPDENYFLSRYVGAVTDSELLDSYRAFLEGELEGEHWQPGMNELVDAQHADFTQLSSRGLRQLQDFAESFLDQQGASMRTAVFAPHDLPYGLARVYAAMAESSPELISIFRDLDNARLWLDQPDQTCDRDAAADARYFKSE